MTIEHAPLPWRAAKYGNCPGWTIDHAASGTVGDGLTDLDAEFIVRACNSHQALLDALRVVVHRWNSESDISAFDIGAARAAIAQAEGRDVEAAAQEFTQYLREHPAEEAAE